MNTHSHSAPAHIQKSVIEHTPIYDLAAYNQRKRQLQRHKLLKNTFDATVFLGMAALTFSILFLGK